MTCTVVELLLKTSPAQDVHFMSHKSERLTTSTTISRVIHANTGTKSNMGNCFSSTKDQDLQGGQPSARKSPVTNEKRANPQRAVMKGQGHKLVDSTINQPVEKLDPREAAKRAAEVRYEQEKGKQGVLGRKLEEERKKSTITHIKEKSQNDYDEKNRKNLVFD